MDDYLLENGVESELDRDSGRNGGGDGLLKATPANMEAEKAVLGSLLIDPDAIIKIANFLRAEDFFRERHTWIYEAVLVLNERREPADFVTLVDELERAGRLEEIGGPAYITELINSTPTAIYVDYYARIVERTAILRRLISAAGRIAELAYDEGQDVDQVVDRAEQLIFGVSESRIHRELTPIRSVMGDVVDRIDFLSRNQGTVMGVPTGFVMLDKTLGGLQKSDLIILAGRPGMGKSSLALSLAQNAAERYKARVAIFSLEMSSEQLVQRLLSMKTGIDSHRLRMGDVYEEEWKILMEAANDLSNTSIFIDDTRGHSHGHPHQSPATLRRARAGHDHDRLYAVDDRQRRRAQREPPTGDQLHQPLPQRAGPGTQRPPGRSQPAQPRRGESLRQAPHAVGSAGIWLSGWRDADLLAG